MRRRYKSTSVMETNIVISVMCPTIGCVTRVIVSGVSNTEGDGQCAKCGLGVKMMMLGNGMR